MSVEAAGEGQYHYQSYALGERPISPAVQKVYRAFSQLANGSEVIDLGCGDGRFARNAPKSRPFRVLGVDQSPIAIARFQEAILGDGKIDEATVGDITDLSLPRGREFRGALAWRVLHALTPHQQLQVADQVRRILPSESPFFIAVASDQDWKARELTARGLLIPNTLNECQEIMGLDESFRVDFYNVARIEQLAKRADFRVEDIEEFKELTGFEHLRGAHPENTYLFAHLVKLG